MNLFNAKTLEVALRATVKEMRAKLEEVPKLDRFRLEICVSGEVMSGDLKVEYALRDGQYGDKVEAGRLQPVFDEFIRRHGWEQRHQALYLPRVDDDDIRRPTLAQIEAELDDTPELGEGGANREP